MNAATFMTGSWTNFETLRIEDSMWVGIDFPTETYRSMSRPAFTGKHGRA